MMLVLPALVPVLVLYVAPILRLGLVSLALEPFGVAYSTLFHEADYGAILATTLRVGLSTSLTCLLLGYPLAYLLASSSDRVRNILLLTVLLPFWTSILVRNYAWIYLLQRRGIVNEILISIGLITEPLQFMFNEFGVVLGMSNALLPFMVLPIYVSLSAQPSSLLEAAASMGARPTAAFLSVTLPLSIPGIAAGCLIVFATSLGFYVTPALLGGGRVLVAATFIAREIEDTLNWTSAASASVVLLAVVLSLVLLHGRIAARHPGSGGDLV
jgi:putative spermidine/putrescine transport system permease protein